MTKNEIRKLAWEGAQRRPNDGAVTLAQQERHRRSGEGQALHRVAD